MSRMTALFPTEASDILCDALPYINDARRYVKEARERVVEANGRAHMSNQDEVKDLLKGMDLVVMTLGEVMSTIAMWSSDMIREEFE